MRPVNPPENAHHGDFRELTCEDGLKRVFVYSGEWQLIVGPEDWQTKYDILVSAVREYLMHPSADGSKERLRKREALKKMVM